MKHNSQLQQLHLLLSSEQSGPTDTQECGTKETDKTFNSLDLDDSSSSGVSSERGDIPNSGRHPCRSHSDSATSRDLSPDQSETYLCSGGSVKSDSFHVLPSNDVPSQHIPLRSVCPLTCTNQPSNSQDDSADFNFAAMDYSHSETTVIDNNCIQNYHQNNKKHHNEENELINCFHEQQQNAPEHGSGAGWCMNGFLGDMSGDGAGDPWESQTVGDLHDCSLETVETLEESGLRPDLPGSQSSGSKNRHQRQIEIEQVHQVYKQIAPHCDHVRQKAWPRVKQFLKDLPHGALVADVGCGNGRYLMINPSIYKLGCDLCPPFLDQARSQGREVMVADNLALPFRDGIFDAVISIGVIHHFASLERRIMAISELSRILSPGGKLMVYVWAFEQEHRKFEGQDVLIPWVKPKVKGCAPRKSLSLTSEPNNDRHRSRSGSCGVGCTDGPTGGRRQRPESRFDSEGEKHRSKSLGDESSTRDLYRSFSIASSQCGRQTIIELDQRVGKAHDGSAVTQEGDQLGNTISSDKPIPERVNEKEGEDFMNVSKWPGQLVSECKKLGKFLRSLSSRSVSLGDEDSDQPDFGVNISDVQSSCQPCYNIDLETDLTTKDTLYTADDFRCGAMPDDVYDTEYNGNVKVVNKLDEYKHTQDSYNSSHDQDFRMTGSCAVGDNDGNTPPIISDCSSQVWHSNTDITTSSSSMTYHDTLSSSGRSKGIADLNTTVDHHSPSTSGGLLYTSDSEDASKQMEIKNSKLVPSQETSYPVSHEVQRSEGISNEHAEPQSTVIWGKCLDETKTDILQSYTHPSYDSNIGAPSRSWTTVSMSESFSNREDLLSSQSDTTIMESQVSSNTYIPDHSSENLQHLASTRESPIHGKEVLKTLSGTLTKTTACVSMGIVHDSTSVHDLNKCLPKCQNKLHNMESEGSNRGQKPVDETSNHGPCRGGPTGAEFKELSAMSDHKDCLGRCDSFPLERGQRTDSSTGKDNILEEISKSHQTKRVCSSPDIRHRDKSSTEMTTDKTHQSIVDNEQMVLQATTRMTINDERRNLPGSSLSREEMPSRGTLKTFISKLTNYFRPHSKTGSNKYGCHHNGNNPAKKLPFESESSDVETSVSSFSTHSSCYPGLFATSKEQKNYGNDDYIREIDPDKYGHDSYDDDFEIISDTERHVDENRTNTDREADRLKLNISVIKNKDNLRHDFVNDVSTMSDEHPKTTPRNVNDDPYVFQVENISHVPVRKASFINNLSQKWSGMFGKRSRGDSRKACLHYSTASVSSSSDGNEDHLNISLTDSEALGGSKYPPHKGPLVRRPNSLDFSKKRTRRGVRRPAPQKELQMSKDMGRVRQFQEKTQLSLSDAMTLLGDGVAEENIIKRLDMPARTIFAEMKRINFAMRKFPMSSLGTSSSKEDITKEIENPGRVPEEATNTRNLTMKMLRDKKLLISHRGFSESLGAQDATKSRRQLFMGNKEIADIDLTNAPGLDKKCISEDFGISFDMLAGNIHKSKCQLLYSCNSDSSQDLAALLGTSPGRHEDDRDFQNRTNNAQVSPEDLIRFDTFGEIRQGSTAGTHHANEMLDRYNADKEDKRLSQYDRRTNAHRAGILDLQSRNSSWEFSQESDILDEASTITNISSNDSCSKLEPGTKLTHPNSSSGKKLPLKAINFILKPRQTRRGNKHRALDYQQPTESNTDNSLSRYYHVFKKGELDQLVTQYVPSLRIVDTFYDHANWCVVAEKLTTPTGV